MPRTAKPTSTKLREFKEEFQIEGIVESADRTLHCRYCGTSLTIKRFSIEQHIKTQSHMKRKEMKEKFQRLDEISTQSIFSKDLCQAFVAADIPLWKLTNPFLVEFLEQYTGRPVPNESTIRKNYVEDSYNTVLQEIRAEIGDGPIWVSIDESTDANGRYIGNVIVGRLQVDEPTQPFLLHSEELPKTNNKTIAKLFNDAMNILWPAGIKHDKVFLFVTDAAKYMRKAASCLTVLYTKMIHVTCLAHALHRVCETVRAKHKTAGTFIACMKKIFLKAPSRVKVFKKLCPHLPLPPRPITTRWGTWLEAADYYCDNFQEIQTVLDALDEKESEAVREAKIIISKDELFSELLNIKMNYVFLIKSIDKLQTSSQPLMESLKIVKDVIASTLKAPDEVVRQKLQFVLKNNPGLNAMQAVLSNDVGAFKKFSQLKEMSPSEIAAFKFAPVVSCDVERSFSIYKNLLDPNRRSFEFNNLKMFLIVACYKKKT